jgi:hypothetical protein
VLAEEITVDGQRQRERPRADGIDGAEERIARQRPARDAPGPVPHARGTAAVQHRGGDREAEQQVCGLQPVAALEVVVRAPHCLWRHPVEVGLGSGPRIARQCSPPGVVDRRDRDRRTDRAGRRRAGRGGRRRLAGHGRRTAASDGQGERRPDQD